jgi:hypothetical protein
MLTWEGPVMRLAQAILLVALLAAPAARAGAWMRDEGTGFLAVFATFGRTAAGLSHDTGFYAEYGARPRLTLGVDVNTRSDLAGHALGFLRVPLTGSGRRTQIALDLGIGAHLDSGGSDWNPMARATLALGRSFASGLGDGWFGVDVAYERRFGQPEGAIKLDSVIGLSSGPRFRPLLQLETCQVLGGRIDWTATASVMIDGRKGRTWVIGVQRGSAEGGRLGIKAALWRSF